MNSINAISEKITNLESKVLKKLCHHDTTTTQTSVNLHPISIDMLKYITERTGMAQQQAVECAVTHYYCEEMDRELSEEEN